VREGLGGGPRHHAGGTSGGKRCRVFWLGLVLIVVFGLTPTVAADIRAVETWQGLHHAGIRAGLFRHPGLDAPHAPREMIEALAADYIRTARAKGLEPVEHHSQGTPLRQCGYARGPRFAAVQLGFMLGGSVVTESVFFAPAGGRLPSLGINHQE